MPGNRRRRRSCSCASRTRGASTGTGTASRRTKPRAQSGIKKVYYARRVRDLRHRDVQSAAARAPPRRGHRRVRRVLRRGRRRTARRWRFALGPRPAPSAPLTPVYEFAAKARDRFVNVTFVDTLPLIGELRQIKTPYEQTLMEQERRHLEQAHMAGMSHRRARQVRVRGRSRDRAGLPGQRRHELGLPLDRRQRPQRHDPALQRIEPADAGRRAAARRRRGQLSGLHRRHHPHLPGQRHVHRGAEGHLPARAGGPGSRHAGGEDRRQDGGHREGSARPSSRPAC